MKKIIILGAGTAGTMMANHLKHHIKKEDWEIAIIDEREEHHYQPGYLFLPFDMYTPDDIIKPIKDFIPEGVLLITKSIDKIVPDENSVLLADGSSIQYDILIIAT